MLFRELRSFVAASQRMIRATSSRSPSSALDQREPTDSFCFRENVLAVGVGNSGVAFLDVHDLIHGKGSALFAHQTDGAGTFDVVATPDGKFVFSSNEYGLVNGQRGSVGIIATHIDRRGRVVHPQTLGQIAAGDVVPSLSISPDGTRVYVASELIRPQDAQSIAGAGNPQLSKTDCVQRRGTVARSNGYISVIDTHRAIALENNAICLRPRGFRMLACTARGNIRCKNALCLSARRRCNPLFRCPTA